MGHNFSSTDLQDLERRKDRALSGENSDIRGMKMEKLRQVKKISRPCLIPSERGLFLIDFESLQHAPCCSAHKGYSANNTGDDL